MSEDKVELKWACKVHGQGFTVSVPCETELDAEAIAYEWLSRGVRAGNRIYPNSLIVYCEILQK